MLMYIDIDGITVPVQLCTRNGKQYWRLAPNFYRPTERQEEVRRNVAYAAWRQKEKDGYTSRENVNQAVAQIFAGWEPLEKIKETKLNNRIKEIKRLSAGVVRNGKVIAAEIR
jgi:hypothetical protein